jgi:hypothetical protein
VKTPAIGSELHAMSIGFACTSFGSEREGRMTSQRFLFVDVDEFVSDVVRISGTLSNLTYLIELDAQNPGLVRQHANQADLLLRALEDLVHSADAQVCDSSCS